MADKSLRGEKAVYRSTATVQYRSASLTSKEHETLTTLAGDRAPDPSIFEEEEPVFFRTLSSNTKLDAYFTRMAESSLANYASDATDPGVQFQNSHNGAGGFFGGGGEVGFGRSLQGKVTGPKSDRSCLIDFYTLPGLKCGNLTSDEFIRGMRAGIYADVSIGFTPGAMICNICGGDFLKRWELDWDDPKRCTHWPGMKYEIEKGNRTVEVQCELSVEDGHLNEVSTVYDGATPGAGIVAVDMARLVSSQGKLPETERILLEHTYRVRIAPPQHIYAVEEDIMAREAKVVTTNAANTGTRVEKDADLVEDTDEAVIELETDDDENLSGDDENTVLEDEDEDEDEEEIEEDRSVADDRMAALRNKLEGRGIKSLGSDPYKAIEVLADAYYSQRQRIRELKREADFGKAYEDELLSSLDDAVVRAFSAKDAKGMQARYRKMAAALSPDEIKELVADLDSKGNERFRSGRSTRDVVEDENDDDLTVADEHEVRGPTPARLVGIRTR